MINKSKWIGSLPQINTETNIVTNQLDHDRWTSTIPKKNNYSSVKKYSLIATLFVCGLLLIPVVKNETRNLQKEINNLEASIGLIKFNLDQAVLDNEVLTSPENISFLAKKHLNTDLVSYKKSQIVQLGDETEIVSEVSKIKKTKKKSVNLKTQIVKKIEKKKEEIKKLQKIYSNPKSIPGEVKNQVAKQINVKKAELKNMYESPKNVITLESFGRWTVVQVIKAFLGMPVIPGR